MATTADYLNKLVTQKNTLADNLTTKGVTASHDETLETLVPKVLDINGGTGGNGIYPIGEDGRPTGNVVVPEGVTSLYRYIFSGDVNVTSVSLPSTLVSLNDSSFDGCTALTDVTMNDNIAIIPVYCFRKTALTNFSMPRALSEIKNYGFKSCSNLQNISFKKSYDISYISLGNYVFEDCTSLDSVNFETDDTLIYPSNYGFSNCTSLGNNAVMEIVNHLYTGAATQNCFSGCTGITDITIPKVGNRMFLGCKSLSHCKILDSETCIYAGLFSGCTSLISVELPATIVSVTSNALTNTGSSYFLYNCTNLETVTVGEGWDMSMRLDVTANLTVDSMVGIFNNLKDLTGETAKTLTLGSTNLAKLTDEQKAIATNKNWTLA